MHLNVEIKAVCRDATTVRNYMKRHYADFKGTDNQVDTYFKVPNGRLKLRQGKIENSLIHYDRANQAGPKDSQVTMMQVNDGKELKRVLTKALGVMVEVRKEREIYFIDNVKFHIDVVPQLGCFVEIEAIDFDGSIGKERLLEQCDFYIKSIGIEPEDLLHHSYSDMIMEKMAKEQV